MWKLCLFFIFCDHTQGVTEPLKTTTTKKWRRQEKQYIYSTPDKWNLQGTEENGSTWRMFHLSEVHIAPGRLFGTPLNESSFYQGFHIQIY